MWESGRKFGSVKCGLKKKKDAHCVLVEIDGVDLREVHRVTAQQTPQLHTVFPTAQHLLTCYLNDAAMDSQMLPQPDWRFLEDRGYN